MSRLLICFGIVTLTLGCAGSKDDDEGADAPIGDDDDVVVVGDDDDDDDSTTAAVGDLSVEPGVLVFQPSKNQLQLTLGNPPPTSRWSRRPRCPLRWSPAPP